jgi:hypothetical protein
MERGTIESQESIPNVAIFLKRTGLEFLQTIFSTRAPGSLCWNKDDTQSEIQISDIHAVDLDAPNKRPAIVAVRGPISWQGLGLGGGAVESRNMATGAHNFTDMILGTVAYLCISREGVEAEQIAHLVFNSFKFFRPTLQQSGFFTIKSLSLSGESLIEKEGADDKTTVVTVQITAMIPDRWVLSEDVGRKLKKIVTETIIGGC